MFKGGRPGPGALRLCVLRTFQPARGGEAFGVLPGSRPRPYGVQMKTQSLVRRATPFVGIAAGFAVAVATGAAELLACPVFLVVVISSALLDGRPPLLTVGAAAHLPGLILRDLPLRRPASSAAARSCVGKVKSNRPARTAGRSRFPLPSQRSATNRTSRCWSR